MFQPGDRVELIEDIAWGVRAGTQGMVVWIDDCPYHYLHLDWDASGEDAGWLPKRFRLVQAAISSLEAACFFSLEEITEWHSK